VKFPRNAPDLVAEAFKLYARYPLLFFTLAAGVIVPYELIVAATTGTALFSRDVGIGTSLTLTLIHTSVITPLVSAMHIHAVAAIRSNREPRIGAVARQGVRVLPVVAAATIVSTLGIALGFLALIVPGVILMLRWVVVAQAAAIENEGWLPALRRSARLSKGHYGHVFFFIVFVGAITSPLILLGGFAFGDSGADVGPFIVGLGVGVLTASFSALASALLYYDLLARFSPAPKPSGAPPPSLDPAAYSDRDRPKGWYVDPSSPDRMRYWGGSERPAWTGTTRTPRKTRRAWRKGASGEKP